MAAAAERSGSTSVRKRRVESSRTEAKAADSSGEHGADTGGDKLTIPESLQSGTFWLTRIVLLRAVAFIYCKRVQPGQRSEFTVSVPPQVICVNSKQQVTEVGCVRALLIQV